MNSTVDLLKRNLSLSYVEKSQRRGKNQNEKRGQTLVYARAFCVTCFCLLHHLDCGCGPAYKFVTLDADPHHKSQRPETCTVRYHGNYCSLHAFEIELHWIAATGCIVNDMVRKLKNLQIKP